MLFFQFAINECLIFFFHLLIFYGFYKKKKSVFGFVFRSKLAYTPSQFITKWKFFRFRLLLLLFVFSFIPQKYEVEFLLQQQWYDPRLRYSNRSRYEFLNAIHHHNDIWLPDTYFIMHGDFKDPLIPVHFALRIYRNGTVNYLMRYFNPSIRALNPFHCNVDLPVCILNLTWI